MKWRTDKFREEAIKYKEGDLVWMNNSNISSDCPAKKLAFKGARLFLSRSLTRDLIFSFISYFISFSFLFFFYFQSSSGQGLSVTLSHQSQLDGIVTRLITGYKKRKQKVLEQSDIIQHGQHMLASCYTHGHLGQGAQQLARTMGTSI